MFLTYNFIDIKKAEGYFPIRKRGSPSPKRTNRKHPPPPYLQGASICFMCVDFILDFSLAQKSAKRFFS